MHRRFLQLVFWVLIPSVLQGQERTDSYFPGDTLVTNVDLFEGTEPLVMTLTFDLRQYQRQKYREDYLPVKLVLQVNDTLEIEKSVRIRSRGQFRKEHCTFVPFWLNISKEEIRNRYLQDVKKIKVVTHCRNSPSYSEYVLKEYLAYRIYNLISPVSFRVRLIRMMYVDTGRDNRVTENWAFMIEPEEMLAERCEAVVVENDQLVMALMRPEEMDRVALFMYMIGNSDYSIAGRHNVKILGLPGFGSEGYTPVPYDFDYTGIVNADYAVPGENLGVGSITERYFLGPCREAGEYQKAIAELDASRTEILELLEGFPYLEEEPKRETMGYVEEYFNRASDSRFIERDLKSTCR